MHLKKKPKKKTIITLNAGLKTARYVNKSPGLPHWEKQTTTPLPDNIHVRHNMMLLENRPKKPNGGRDWVMAHDIFLN